MAPKGPSIHRGRLLSHIDRAQIRWLVKSGGVFDEKAIQSIYGCNPRAYKRARDNNLKGNHKADVSKDHFLLDEAFLRVVKTQDLDLVRRYVGESIDRQEGEKPTKGATPKASGKRKYIDDSDEDYQTDDSEEDRPPPPKRPALRVASSSSRQQSTRSTPMSQTSSAPPAAAEPIQAHQSLAEAPDEGRPPTGAAPSVEGSREPDSLSGDSIPSTTPAPGANIIPKEEQEEDLWIVDEEQKPDLDSVEAFLAKIGGDYQWLRQPLANLGVTTSQDLQRLRGLSNESLNEFLVELQGISNITSLNKLVIKDALRSFAS